MTRHSKMRLDEATEFEIKRLTEHLKRLKIAFNANSYRLEWTLTPFTKLKPPKGYRLMDPTWSYAECPKCHSVAIPIAHRETMQKFPTPTTPTFAPFAAKLGKVPRSGIERSRHLTKQPGYHKIAGIARGVTPLGVEPRTR